MATTVKETFSFKVPQLVEKLKNEKENPSGRVYVEAEMPVFSLAELAEINAKNGDDVAATICRREVVKLASGIKDLVTDATDLSTPEAIANVQQMLANKFQEIVSAFNGTISVETPGKKNVAKLTAKELLERKARGETVSDEEYENALRALIA